MYLDIGMIYAASRGQFESSQSANSEVQALCQPKRTQLTFRCVLDLYLSCWNEDNKNDTYGLNGTNPLRLCHWPEIIYTNEIRRLMALVIAIMGRFEHRVQTLPAETRSDDHKLHHKADGNVESWQHLLSTQSLSICLLYMIVWS